MTELMQRLDADVYINLQCDEPLVRSEEISTLAQGMLADSSVQIGTLCHRLPASEADNPHLVKVVVSSAGDALYFNRSPIPYNRTEENSCYYKYVGIYAYRREVLEGYSGLPQLMMAWGVKLEQLCLLSAGFRIRVFEVDPVGSGVDTRQGVATMWGMMKDRQM
nr:hypothetical protein [uncultured Desulfobulbus sp.]